MANLLLVGDDRERTGGIREILGHDGHRVILAKDIRRWLDAEKAESPEVVVAAVAEPDALLQMPLATRRPFAPPILFIHRDTDEASDPFVEERLIDRITSPFPSEELLGRVDALVRVRRVVLHHDAETETRKSRWADALGSILRSKVPRPSKPAAPYLEVAARVADWADRRDGFEPGHAERVTNFAAMIADELDLTDGEAMPLLRAAMLHDIGKIALPIEMLRQKTPLGDGQLRLLRTHPERGAAILRALDRDEAVADAILNHHEYVDGSGYYGKKGDDIPRASRILAVAEAFDAMTTSLVRKPLTRDGALGLMQERRGAQWDAQSVDALMQALKPKPFTVPLSGQ